MEQDQKAESNRIDGHIMILRQFSNDTYHTATDHNNEIFGKKNRNKD